DPRRRCRRMGGPGWSLLWRRNDVTIFSVLTGYKTYIAAVGLLGLSIYQASQGQFDQAAQSLFGALAAVGLHSAIVRSSN
ncbi:MAG: hypothetical protein LC745_07215, partial [Planctomycetia bacterium]|nr:hypothetical protein [Planctomycetia bacterium]